MSGKILVMGAMEDVELNLLKEKLENQTQRTEGRYHFYEGTIEGKEVVLVNTKVGSINATAATILAVQYYHPKVIISQGIAGGHGKEVKQKDLIVSSDVLNINSYQTVEQNGKEGEKTFYRLEDYTDETLNPLPVITSDSELLSISKTIPYEQGKVHVGRIASGDIWNKSEEKITWLHQEYQTVCEEMEGYAIGKIARDYQIPFISIRSISNNEILKQSYDRTVGELAQEFVLKVIKELPN